MASPKRNVDVRAHKTGTVTVGYERQLWEIADTLRASMDAEYRHVVLGRILLKYVSDVFEEYDPKFLQEIASGAHPEDPDKSHANDVLGRVYEHSSHSSRAPRARRATSYTRRAACTTRAATQSRSQGVLTGNLSNGKRSRYDRRG